MITLKEAKRLSLIKWEIFAKNDGRTRIQKSHEVRNHHELCTITNGCGFCERNTIIDHEYEADLDCGNCELAKVMNGPCGKEGSLYYNWNNYGSNDHNSAQLIVDAIKSIPIED